MRENPLGTKDRSRHFLLGMCNCEQRHSSFGGKLSKLVMYGGSGLAPILPFQSVILFCPLGGVALMEAVKAEPQKPIPIRHWKPQDWIDHASFGVGQVSVSRGDKLDIDFVNGGRKTLLKSTELNRAVAPSAGFKFPRDKSKARTGELKVKSGNGR
jgi:hypothetical protein